jgi:DNA-3-methyladenine glycosylase II
MERKLMNNTDIELAAFHLSKNDPVLANLIEKIGYCTLKKKKDHFDSLLGSVIGQQLSLKAAESIYNRVKLHFKDGLLPAYIINETDENLRKLGLSNAKVKYVKDLSQRILAEELVLKRLPRMPDDKLMESLTAVKGIGSWTAHMFMIFSLSRLNVLPTGDLGLKRAIMINYRLRKMPDEKKIIQISKKNNWAPYNSVASWYLWKSLEI